MFDNIVLGSKSAPIQLPVAQRAASHGQTHLWRAAISGGLASAYNGTGALVSNVLF